MAVPHNVPLATLANDVERVHARIVRLSASRNLVGVIVYPFFRAHGAIIQDTMSGYKPVKKEERATKYQISSDKPQSFQELREVTLYETHFVNVIQ